LQQPAAASAELAAFFADYDKAELALSPLSKAYRGIRDADYGKWDEYTDAAAEESRALDTRTLAEMRRRFDRAALSRRISSATTSSSTAASAAN
jgi:hypothetical protein